MRLWARRFGGRDVVAAAEGVGHFEDADFLSTVLVVRRGRREEWWKLERGKSGGSGEIPSGEGRALFFDPGQKAMQEPAMQLCGNEHVSRTFRSPHFR